MLSQQSHFIDQKTEAQGSWVTCGKSCRRQLQSGDGTSNFSHTEGGGHPLKWTGRRKSPDKGKSGPGRERNLEGDGEGGGAGGDGVVAAPGP